MADLEKLRYAVAVAREGSLSAAASAIPLSQSALTRSLQSLEREYGLRFFDRGKSGARLTPEGAVFIAQAESLLQHADNLEEDLRAFSSGRGATVRFGMAPVSAATFLPDCLPALLHNESGVRIRIRIGPNGLLRDLLQRGEIEFYIGGVPRDSDNFLSSNGLRVDPLADSSRLELLVRQGHPLLESELTREALSRFPVVSPPFVRDTLQGTDIEALGIQKPTIELDDYGMLLELSLRSDAVLVTSSVFTADSSTRGLVRLALDLTALRPVTYALVSRIDREPSAASRKLAADIVSRVTASIRNSPAG
jgi:DNA-binding transcriptional LysR family regulator